MTRKSELSTVQKRLLVDFVIHLSQIICFTGVSTVWYFRGYWILGTAFLVLDIAVIIRQIVEVYKIIRQV